MVDWYFTIQLQIWDSLLNALYSFFSWKRVTLPRHGWFMSLILLERELIDIYNVVNIWRTFSLSSLKHVRRMYNTTKKYPMEMKKHLFNPVTYILRSLYIIYIIIYIYMYVYIHIYIYNAYYAYILGSYYILGSPFTVYDENKAKLQSAWEISKGAILVATDVVGLYPSIPHCEGLNILKNNIKSNPISKYLQKI